MFFSLCLGGSSGFFFFILNVCKTLKAKAKHIFDGGITNFTEITRDSAGSELEQYSDEDYSAEGRRGRHGGADYYNRRKR